MTGSRMTGPKETGLKAFLPRSETSALAIALTFGALLTPIQTAHAQAPQPAVPEAAAAANPGPQTAKVAPSAEAPAKESPAKEPLAEVQPAAAEAAKAAVEPAAPATPEAASASAATADAVPLSPAAPDPLTPPKAAEPPPVTLA